MSPRKKEELAVPRIAFRVVCHGGWIQRQHIQLPWDIVPVIGTVDHVRDVRALVVDSELAEERAAGAGRDAPRNLVIQPAEIISTLCQRAYDLRGTRARAFKGGNTVRERPGTGRAYRIVTLR